MDDTRLQQLDWYPELIEYIRQALRHRAEHQHNQRPSLEHELQALQAKKKGWSLSLAKPNLNANVRDAIEVEWAKAVAREQEIEATLQELNGREHLVEELVDPAGILDRLNRLADILAANNPTMGNLELSLHIDRIDCYADGKVILRTCKLGALTGAADLLADKPSGDNGKRQAGDRDAHQGRPRRRARLRVEDLDGSYPELRHAADMAADSDRFAGLQDDWFWEDRFQIPRRISWAEKNAAQVAKKRAEGLTMVQLAAHFGKSVPTIRESLKYAAAVDKSVNQLPAKMPRRRWHEDHAVEVAGLQAEGMNTDQLAEHFGKSDTTIRKALAHARQLTDRLRDGSEQDDTENHDHVGGSP